MVNTYFLDIFSSMGSSVIDIDARGVQNRLSAENKLFLDQPFTMDDIRVVLNKMGTNKASGFFKFFWQLIDVDVS